MQGNCVKLIYLRAGDLYPGSCGTGTAVRFTAVWEFCGGGGLHVTPSAGSCTPSAERGPALPEDASPHLFEEPGVRRRVRQHPGAVHDRARADGPQATP